jgi:TPR repeat protein
MGQSKNSRPGPIPQESRQSSDEQFDLGCNELSRGRISEAINWLELAASQGHRDAAWELARIYAGNKGEQLNCDKEKSSIWLKKAADKGHIPAINAFGEYLREKGDQAGALKYFEKGAKRGWSDALTNLGLAYRNGEATNQDPVKAFECFSTADRKGNYSATYQKDPTLAMVNSWNLYLFYRDGVVVESDPKQAFLHCKNAWKLPEAKFAIASMFETGYGVSQNWRDALKWYTLAAECGHPGAEEKARELEQEVIRDEAFSQIQLCAIEILRETFAKEIVSDFPLLKQIPRTSIIHLIDHVQTLDNGQRQALIDGLATFSSFSLMTDRVPQTNRVENWQKHPGLGPYYRESFKQRNAVRYASITDCASGNVRMEDNGTFVLRHDLVPSAKHAVPVKAAHLRKLTDAMMKQLFSESLEIISEPNGNRVYKGSLDGDRITVRVQFAPKWIGQLRYEVRIEPPEGQAAKDHWLSLETLWFQTKDTGWNYITEENAERCVSALPQLIKAVQEIIKRVPTA